MERRKKIAVELSDLVVYCRPVPFNEDSKEQKALCFSCLKQFLCDFLFFFSSPSHLCDMLLLPEIGTDRACYRDMSSFPETKAEKFATRSRGKRFLQYNRRQLSRVYPRGQRLDSSNYDPLPMWICGSQLVALNFQTPGQCTETTSEQSLLYIESRGFYTKLVADSKLIFAVAVFSFSEISLALTSGIFSGITGKLVMLAGYMY